MLTSLLQSAKDASIDIALLDEATINGILLRIADSIHVHSQAIIEANSEDLAKMSPDNPLYDRLKLTDDRLAAIASDMRNVASLPSPLGRILKQSVLPNGLELTRISVPFGVIGVVYEARPNVTFDVFSLCLKAGSACVLKGGKDADATNQKVVGIIRQILTEMHINPDVITLLPATHEATAQLLHANGLVDLVIPRGSKRLIDFVRTEASVPVIETGAGVCHAYFDKDADLQKGTAIINNAKTRRVSVCNALDCMLLHEDRLSDLPAICRPLQDSNVLIYADAPSLAALQGSYPAELLRPSTDESYGTEFLSYTMAIKTVASANEAIRHIRHNGSGHSECIITDNEATASQFLRQVDAACVYHNAPTAFTDGAQFGLGAEIGISTQKLHARGPMALEEITTYKWIIKGNGQVRK
ncbi:MAG: glutamate-5-semialdehyde dehydrogenase [Bacteroidaceae bacterium]|nr:glutamate-5-semialdehyde dehydrogenase [Bacteroidaceae bacterium]